MFWTGNMTFWSTLWQKITSWTSHARYLIVMEQECRYLPHPQKLQQGDKHPYSINAGDDSTMCCLAGGYPILPYVMLDWKFIKPEFAEGEVAGTTYGTSSNGRMNSELFDLWSPTPARWIIAHYQLRFVQKAAEEEAIVFCLPPHTTHRTQPLHNCC